MLRNLLVLIILASGTLALLYFPRPVSAANKFWIASTQGNFNVNANWSTSSGGPANTTAPGPADLAIFDGNGLGNCTITADTTVTGIQINAGYTTGPGTGTILQGTSNLTLSGAFTQADGTFTGGSGAIDFNGNFTLSGGTFTASSTTTSFAQNFTPRGTLAPNGGTVVFDGGSDTAIDLGAAPGVPGTLTLNNVTVNKTGGGGRVIISGDPDTLAVAGTLTLTDGVVLAGGVTATLEAQGALSIASTFDGGDIILLISGAATRTVTLGAGVLLPPLTVNAPNVTVNTSGAGAITFTRRVNVQSVALFTNGTVDFVFNAGVVFTQSGGTFTGGSGLIDFNATFTLLGGTFTASSTTTSFASTFTPRGTFNSNGGTVVFDGAGDTEIDLGAAPGVPGSLTLNNVTVNKTGGGGRVIISGDPDTLVVAGTLTLTDGVVLAGGVNATLEAQGDLSIASTFGGGNIILLISGAATRTVVLGAGALLPRLTVNAPNVTVNTSGTGAITFTQPVNIQSVALFANGAVDFIFNDTGVVFTQSGGTFTGGSGLIDFNGNFTLSGGTFTASSTTTSFAATFTKTGGTFNPNGGTVVFDGSGESLLNVSPPTLNNLTVNKPNNVAVVLNFQETLVVAGTLTLTNGVFNKNGDLSTATLEAQGDVAIASTFDGGTVNFRLSGSANQTYTNGGGLNVTSVWTIDKPAGAVTLASNLILNNNQPLTITSGRLDQGASFNLQTSNTLTVGANGVLRNFGGGNLTLGGNVSNSGIVNINGGGTGCGDPGVDPLQIRSTVDTTVRTWSGNGTFSLVDVDVNSQAAGTPPGAITAFGSSVLGPNMGTGWTLNLGCPVEINSQPTNQTACVGGSTSFSVGATGTGLSFQWRRAGTPLSNGGNISIVSGTNSSTLTINPVGAGDAASYDVVVTSSLGLTTTSNQATLSLLTAPAITTNPVDTNVCDGATASFTAAASGNPTPTVQWQVSTDGGANFGNISGATSTTLSFTASASQNGNRFRAVFTNSCSSATTTAATLTVNPPDLAIDKSHTGDFTVGTNGVYTIAVTNSGSCSTTGTITVTDPLPNGLSFVSGTGPGWSCSATGQNVTCTNAGPLAALASSIITLTVGVAQAAVPAVTNTATVSTPNDGNAANNSDSDPTTVNGSGGAVSAGELIISEFRLRGPGPSPTPNATQMAADEFVEIYNNTNSNITVQAADGSPGFAVATADGVARCVIPNATVIPARDHFLCVNSVGYSLSSYPAGNQPSPTDDEPRWGAPRKPTPVTGSGVRRPTGITPPPPNVPNVPSATGDATYTLDIPDNAGIALFRTANPANFNLTNRLDAVGSTSETNTLFKEGAGYPALTSVVTVDHSFYRSLCSFVAACTTPGRPKDTDSNAVDFLYVSTDGIDAGAGPRMGAPGPENLGSPLKRDATIPVALLDATQTGPQPPNRVRDLTSDPGNNSTFGTMSIRRRVTNNTGANVTRLRFRIIEITTLPPPNGSTADIRARTSTTVTGVSVNDAATCAAKAPPESAPCVVDVEGLTLEQPPNQPNGGGFNSTLSAGTITLATPLTNGASVNVNFLLGVQQTGTFRILVIVEALP